MTDAANLELLAGFEAAIDAASFGLTVPRLQSSKYKAPTASIRITRAPRVLGANLETAEAACGFGSFLAGQCQRHAGARAYRYDFSEYKPLVDSE
jgi:hypothetical protein